MENSSRSPRFLSIVEERKSTIRQSLSHIFQGPAESVCEFGCGHGHFLVAYAQAHPSALCIGLDIESARVERARKKQERAATPRLHFLHADANLFLDTLPVTVMFSAVFILFPDPWPKKRHHKHRLIQPDFLSKLQSRSTANTRVYFRTDHDPYFEEASNMFSSHPTWELTREAWPFEHPTVFQSRAVSHRSLVARPRQPAA